MARTVGHRRSAERCPCELGHEAACAKSDLGHATPIESGGLSTPERVFRFCWKALPN